MKTSEILSKRYNEDKELFQKVLRKIKPFSKYPDKGEIPIEDLEKLIAVYEYKYSIQLDYIHPLFFPGEERMYSVVIRNTDTKELYPLIYSNTVYEALCKVCIFYYSEITFKGSVGLKDWTRRFEK